MEEIVCGCCRSVIVGDDNGNIGIVYCPVCTRLVCEECFGGAGSDWQECWECSDGAVLDRVDEGVCL